LEAFKESSWAPVLMHFDLKPTRLHVFLNDKEDADKLT
jgi:hypothetical protein